MKIVSLKRCFEDMRDELEFDLRCEVGPTLKDTIAEVLELKKIEKIKDTIQNELRNIEQ
jgi:hypothetical protein